MRIDRILVAGAAAALAVAPVVAATPQSPRLARALDTEARRDVGPAVSAAHLGRAFKLQHDECVALLGLDELVWVGAGGTEARVPFREVHAAIARRLVDSRAAGREATMAGALALAETAGFRAAALAVGRLATRSETEWLGAVASLATDADASQRRGFAEAVHLWAERTVPSAADVRELRAATDARLGAALARGLLGGPGDPEGTADAAMSARALAAMGAAPALDVFIAALIAERAGPVEQAFDVSPLLGLLHAPDARARASAAQALGTLRHPAAIAPLLERLGDTEPRARAAAHRALRDITRQSLDASPEAWRAWHRTSRAWFEETLPRLDSDLRSGERDRISRALLDIARHPEHAWFTAPLVIDASHDRDPAVAGIAAAALGHLATPASRARLVDLLESRSARRRAAALAALRRLTGEDHGKDAERWRRTLPDPR